MASLLLFILCIINITTDTNEIKAQFSDNTLEYILYVHACVCMYKKDTVQFQECHHDG